MKTSIVFAIPALEQNRSMCVVRCAAPRYEDNETSCLRGALRPRRTCVPLDAVLMETLFLQSPASVKLEACSGVAGLQNVCSVSARVECAVAH
jgi:hypothetical protein